MLKPKLLVVCHANLGTSLSGGDRIFLNLIKYWQPHFDITALASPEAKRLILRNQLNLKIITTTSLPTVTHLSTFHLTIHHTLRFITAKIFSLTHWQLFKQYQYIYTSSDFYGDLTFGVFAKIFNPQIKWLCGYYLLAPFPTDPTSPYLTNHHPIRGLIYYLAQRPTVLLARLLADFVFVTSFPDIQIFENNRLPKNKIIIVQGGVTIPSSKIISSLKPIAKRHYDAFFLGRLHNQKGVMEMIEIWSRVTKKLPKAQLVIVGDGELMSRMTSRIKELNLTKNIKVIGFLVGPKKFALIKNSKIVLHPATYDSGGMAAAEAMAWGLPGVSFDLPALKTYYPKGMVKVPLPNVDKFADAVVKLLTDKEFYKIHSIDARALTIENWNWKTRFENIYQAVIAR
ncbi:MAG: glycosyltransferase [Candidatus Shapirobacteria bacterium]|jgi:glycosyltransferase involved in cell wall biosynthesis